MKDLIVKIIQKAAPQKLELPRVIVQEPNNPAYGDYATNLPLLLAPLLGEPPVKIAQKLAANIQDPRFEKVMAAPNGFVNFKLSHSFLQNHLKEIVKQNKKYGQSSGAKGEKVLVEFVSANPTGPLHIGHGRWAVIGDDISSLLEAVGYKVTREFYVNDIGGQIDKLVASVIARMDFKPAPEGGYGGEYIKDLAEQLKPRREHPNFKNILVTQILEGQKKVLLKLGVKFDKYFLESGLHTKGKVKAAVKRMEEKGHTFLEGGAVWFKSQEQGDDKNRVLVRESGETTYFAADLAYHQDKYERKFDRLINIWGTDHHGYVKRLKNAMASLGYDEKKLEIIIGQLVSLYRGQEQVRMSKRTGEMITLEEVIDEIGKDATRFFLTMVSVNSHLDFDLELAKKQASDNPVYYVQYAHARICSIFHEAREKGYKPVKTRRGASLQLLIDPSERALMRSLLNLPDEIIYAAQKCEPHKLVEYAKNLAALFHSFYHNCRVLSDDRQISEARLYLVEATRIVLKNVLILLKVGAPERM